MAGDRKLSYAKHMNRRQLLASLTAAIILPPSLAHAAEWETRLIKAMIGDELQFGLHIKLAPGWKTYWRVPGVAGIPPLLKVEGADIDHLEINYPLPLRITDESGEAIGYHDEVVFILKPVLSKVLHRSAAESKVSAFFGVCKEICRPAKFQGALTTAISDDTVMKKFIAQVPMPADFITSAQHSGDQLALNLKQPLDDIFVEGATELYFRKPVFGDGHATFKIDGLAEGKRLSGEKLRITGSSQGKGLEQTIQVT